MKPLLVFLLALIGTVLGTSHVPAFKHHEDAAYLGSRIVTDSPIYAKMGSTSTSNGFMNKFVSSGSDCNNVIAQSSNITGVCLAVTNKAGSTVTYYGSQLGSFYYYCEGSKMPFLLYLGFLLYLLSQPAPSSWNSETRHAPTSMRIKPTPSTPAWPATTTLHTATSPMAPTTPSPSPALQPCLRCPCLEHTCPNSE